VPVAFLTATAGSSGVGGLHLVRTAQRIHLFLLVLGEVQPRKLLRQQVLPLRGLRWTGRCAGVATSQPAPPRGGLLCPGAREWDSVATSTRRLWQLPFVKWGPGFDEERACKCLVSLQTIVTGFECAAGACRCRAGLRERLRQDCGLCRCTSPCMDIIVRT